MLTDDPGTPGDGRVEANIAATLESEPHRRLWELPILDLNYGVGDRIQLNLQTSLNVLQQSGQGPAAGTGSTSAAVKWRFFEKDDGLSVSIFPRIERDLSSASARRGLADDGTRVFLPIELARKVGLLDLDLELGASLSTADRNQWVYGLVGGVSAGPGTDLMAELHGESTGFTQGQLTANVGLKQKLAASAYLITSVGHDIYTPSGTAPAFIAYFGVQALF